MNSAALNERIGKWQVALNEWSQKKHEFEQYTQPPDPYMIAWLENYLHSTYDHIMNPLLKEMKKPKGGWPYITYILFTAEALEPPFQSYCQFVLESSIFTELEQEKLENDHLLYLMCGNSQDEPKTYCDNLNKEIDIIKRILVSVYTDTKLKPPVYSCIEKARNSTDVPVKRFIILMALMLESKYRERFLPPKPWSKNTKFLAKPTRFVLFIEHALKPKFSALRAASIGGLHEFVRETCPMYAIIDK